MSVTPCDVITLTSSSHLLTDSGVECDSQLNNSKVESWLVCRTLPPWALTFPPTPLARLIKCE